MFRFLLLFVLSMAAGNLLSQNNFFDGNQTPTYERLVHFYDSLAKKKQLELYNMGSSDYGLPIYLCILNGQKDSLKTFESLKTRGSIFINNGIHPGEPDGINACGKLALDYINHKLKMDAVTTLSFILCYNVDGMMVRSSTSRANQNGPQEYGFRGNAQNLDLNRDFIKMDSENAFTFVKIFQAVQPDVFIDTHVSNGADYQYTLTLIHSMKERLTPQIRSLTYNHFVPDLEAAMKKHKIDLVPYVETVDKTPESGLTAFNDLPRYAMGYASLFPCISVTTETHMWKPFEERVQATYTYLTEVVLWSKLNLRALKNTKKAAWESINKQQIFRYSYELTEQKDSILFCGYEHGYRKSEVTGLDRLYYDRTKPYTKKVPYFNIYQAKDSCKIPKYYVVGAQCKDIIARLKQNQVTFQTVSKDSTIDLTWFRVRDYSNGTRPYEGHFLHRDIKIDEQQGKLSLKRGDIIIPTDQKAKLLLCSALEPEAEDSYFAWNFMDSYVQEKEYFSDYIFEDMALKILNESAELRTLFEAKKKMDTEFAANDWEQLYFIYQNSQYFEPSFMRLPIFKIY